jgi:hypothetical protein
LWNEVDCSPASGWKTTKPVAASVTPYDIAATVDCLDHVVQHAGRLKEIEVAALDEKSAPVVEAEDLACDYPQVGNPVQDRRAVSVARRAEPVKCSVLPRIAIMLGLARGLQTPLADVG